MQHGVWGMHSLAIGLATGLVALWVFTGASQAQSKAGGSITPTILRGTSADPDANKKPAPPKAQPQQHAQQKAPPAMRATRYGPAPATAPAPQQPAPPPVLDTTSPRTLTLVNFNTKDTLTVLYWSAGAYHRDALDQLNAFLRDSRDNEQTEMDPLLFDVLWHTMKLSGFEGAIEVLSAYRSPNTNAWLASVSRGVARDSQHMNGNAMDIRFPGVPVFKIRQAARSLEMGGVGYYPRSGFVHLDTGPVRYW
jgi:uncharacterized protein YcbK (DUF882 family)